MPEISKGFSDGPGRNRPALVIGDPTQQYPRLVRFRSLALIAVIVASVVVWRSFALKSVPRTSNPVPARPALPAIDMSMQALSSAGAACKYLVGDGGRLEQHRHGKTGLSPDRVLLYRWGALTVTQDPITGRYKVRSFVDTLSGYGGNIVRTPFNCDVRTVDFVVVSLNFEQIQFPRE